MYSTSDVVVVDLCFGYCCLILLEELLEENCLKGDID